MNQILQITSSPKQKQILILVDGSPMGLDMYFCPMQLCWFIRELTYRDFAINGLKITNSPNMLHQFKNQIPFGLACFTKGNREPSLQEDFSSQNSRLFILTAEDCATYEEFLTSG